MGTDLGYPGRLAGRVFGVVHAEVRIRPRIAWHADLPPGLRAGPEAWNDDPVGLDDQADLWPAMAQVFVRQAEKAPRRRLQGYRTEESAQLVMRGRLREADQLRVRAGLAIPLELRYDEYDIDIAENQLLRAAAERLVNARRPGAHHPAAAPPDRVGYPKCDVSSRVNHRHTSGEPAQRAVPTRAGAGAHGPGCPIHRHPRRRCPSYRIPRQHEYGVRRLRHVALTRALAPFGGRCQPQDQRHPMDVDGNVRLRPDLVRYGVRGAPQAVIDAKYKAEAPSGFPYADLYQLLAYCTATKLAVGHLIYAEGGTGDHDVVVRNADIVLRRHVLDLQQPVSELQAQIDLLARIIARP